MSSEAEYLLSRFGLHEQRFVTRRDVVEAWELLSGGDG